MAQVLLVLDALEATGCSFWLEGGWGIDALVGRQTRPHQDVDIDFDGNCADEVISAIEAIGYKEHLDERPTRIEFLHPDGSCVDLHPLVILPHGGARQIAPDGSTWTFQAEWFTLGSLGGRSVPCYTDAGQRYFHSGYEHREVDTADLVVLDHASSPGDQ